MADYTPRTLTYEIVTPSGAAAPGATITAHLLAGGADAVFGEDLPAVAVDVPVRFTESASIPGTYSAQLIPNTGALDGTRYRIEQVVAGHQIDFYILMPAEDVGPGLASELEDIIQLDALATAPEPSVIDRLFSFLRTALVGGSGVTVSPDAVARTITLSFDGSTVSFTVPNNSVGVDQLSQGVRDSINASIADVHLDGRDFTFAKQGGGSPIDITLPGETFTSALRTRLLGLFQPSTWARDGNTDQIPEAKYLQRTVNVFSDTAQIAVGRAQYRLTGDPDRPEDEGPNAGLRLSGGGNAGSYDFDWGDLTALPEVAPAASLSSANSVIWNGASRIIYLARATDGKWRVGSDTVGPLPTLTLRRRGSELENFARRNLLDRVPPVKLGFGARAGQTTRFLREDGNFADPPSGGGGLATVATDGFSIKGTGAAGDATELRATGLKSQSTLPPVADADDGDRVVVDGVEYERVESTGARNVWSGTLTASGQDFVSDTLSLGSVQADEPENTYLPTIRVLKTVVPLADRPPALYYIFTNHTTRFTAQDLLPYDSGSDTTPRWGFSGGTDRVEYAAGDVVSITVFKATVSPPSQGAAQNIEPAAAKWVPTGTSSQQIEPGLDQDEVDARIEAEVQPWARDATTQIPQAKLPKETTPSGNTFPGDPEIGDRFRLLSAQTTTDDAAMTIGQGTGVIGWFSGASGYGSVDRSMNDIQAVYFSAGRYTVIRSAEDARLPASLVIGSQTLALTAQAGTSVHVYQSAAGQSSPGAVGDRVRLNVVYTDSTKARPDVSRIPELYDWDGVRWVFDSGSVARQRERLTSSSEPWLPASQVTGLGALNGTQRIHEGSATGISVANSNTDRFNNLQLFTRDEANNLYGLDLTDQQRGEIEVSVVLHMTSTTPPTFTSENLAVARFSRLFFASELRATDVYAQNNPGGIVVGSRVVYSGSTALGTLTLRIERDGQDRVGYRLTYVGAGTLSQTFAVQMELNAVWAPTDAPADAPAPAASGPPPFATVEARPAADISIPLPLGDTWTPEDDAQGNEVWRTIATITPTAAQAGRVEFLGQIHAESSHSNGGGDRVYYRTRLMRRGAAQPESTHVRYIRNSGQQDADFQAITRIGTDEISAEATVAAGQTYDLQVRVLAQVAQAAGQTRTVDFDRILNYLKMYPVGRSGGDAFTRTLIATSRALDSTGLAAGAVFNTGVNNPMFTAAPSLPAGVSVTQQFIRVAGALPSNVYGVEYELTVGAAVSSRGHFNPGPVSSGDAEAGANQRVNLYGGIVASNRIFIYAQQSINASGGVDTWLHSTGDALQANSVVRVHLLSIGPVA